MKHSLALIVLTLSALATAEDPDTTRDAARESARHLIAGLALGRPR